jgi:hypothetical protein
MSALTPAGLRSFRESDRVDPAVLVAFLVGTALGVVHPLGVVAGAVLVGLVATTPERAVVLGTYLAGVTVGVLGLLDWFVGYTWSLSVTVTWPVVLAAAVAVAALVALIVRSLL